MLDKIKVPLYEQETTITHMGSDGYAEVYSCEPGMLKKLAKLARQSPDVIEQHSDISGTIYAVPWSFIRVTTPRKLHLSEKERRNRSNRMKRWNRKQSE
jgi:hypothetical protein